MGDNNQIGVLGDTVNSKVESMINQVVNGKSPKEVLESDSPDVTEFLKVFKQVLDSSKGYTDSTQMFYDSDSNGVAITKLLGSGYPDSIANKYIAAFNKVVKKVGAKDTNHPVEYECQLKDGTLVRLGIAATNSRPGKPI